MHSNEANVLGTEGTWRDLTLFVTDTISGQTNQIRAITEVTKAVALGDLSKQVEIDAQGEILDLKCTVNHMVTCLVRPLSKKVSRVTLDLQEGTHYCP